MKYLTKIFVSSVIMSSVAYAEFVSDIHIGISNAQVLHESYTEFNGGYGFNKLHISEYLNSVSRIT